jgi:hypothetical protein
LRTIPQPRHGLERSRRCVQRHWKSIAGRRHAARCSQIIRYGARRAAQGHSSARQQSAAGAPAASAPSRRESCANHRDSSGGAGACPRNALPAPANREINREFRRIRPFTVIFASEQRASFNSFQRDSLRNGQGIFKRVSGNVFRGTGNFNRGTRETRPHLKHLPSPQQTCHRTRGLVRHRELRSAKSS